MKKYILLLLLSIAVFVALIGFLLAVIVVKKFATLNIVFVCVIIAIVTFATALYSCMKLNRYGFVGVELRLAKMK